MQAKKIQRDKCAYLTNQRDKCQARRNHTYTAREKIQKQSQTKKIWSETGDFTEDLFLKIFVLTTPPVATLFTKKYGRNQGYEIETTGKCIVWKIWGFMLLFFCGIQIKYKTPTPRSSTEINKN